MDPFEIDHERLLIFRGHVAQRVANLVHDTKLNFGIGIDRRDGLGKAGQAVDGGDQKRPKMSTRNAVCRPPLCGLRSLCPTRNIGLGICESS